MKTDSEREESAAMRKENEKNTVVVSEMFSNAVRREYIDVATGEKVAAHISGRSEELLSFRRNARDLAEFEKLSADYAKLFVCDDVWHTWDFGTESADFLYDFGIDSAHCIALRWEERGMLSKKSNRVIRKYIFCIFPETILVFFDPGDDTRQFLCALYLSALRVTFSAFEKEKKTVVRETIRGPIEYFYKFNPSPDSRILSCRWQRINSDGNRSFAGGLKPENNPLIFQLGYGRITVQICGLTANIECSNAAAAKCFAEDYADYMKGLSPAAGDEERQGKWYNSARNTVKKHCVHKVSLRDKYKTWGLGKKIFVFAACIFGAFWGIGIIIGLAALLWSKFIF